MSWLQLHLALEAEEAERLCEALEELGALAVTLQPGGEESRFDRIDESPTLWRQTRLTALFDADCDPQRVLAALAARIAPAPLPGATIEPLADRDWNRAWMDRFQPMCFGRRLWVVPSWHTPPQPGAVNITLDPGMAFGTGTHPTTALCLTWLDGADLEGKTVIDYGCGSGILAIAAVKLGAALAYAVDIDPQCLAVTRENAERNGVAERLVIGAPDACPRAPVDVLLANILAGPLVDLAPRLVALVRPRGHLVLSGLLAAQAQECLAAYAGSFNMNPAVVREEWAMLIGTRRQGR